MSEILVLAEHSRGKIKDVTFEMLGIGRELADSIDAKITALILTNDDSLANKLSPYADTVLLHKDEIFKDFNSEVYQSILTKLISERKPVLTLIGHTPAGIDLAPNLAVSTNLPLVADCVGLKFENSKLRVMRQMYTGKINTSIGFTDAQGYIVMVRPASFQISGQMDKTGGILKLDMPVEKVDYKKFIDYIEPEITGVDITKSQIIVAVGRGIKEKENLSIIEKFSSSLNSAIAGSRPVIDKQILPPDRQVGSSGKTVKPKVYIAVGISGAFQHVMGMKDSELIIAINKDANAPIFDVAHYGIVGDLFKVVPVLTQKINELKSGK